MVWERYCNASPKLEFFLFSLFIFSFISQLIWVRLGWNFHRWFSIQKQVNWCTIDPFSLKFCTSQHSYPVPLNLIKWKCSLNDNIVVPGLVFKHNQEATCRVKWDRPGLDFQIRSGSSSVFEAWLYVSLLPAMFGLLLMLRFTRWRKLCASFHSLSMLPTCIGTNLTFTIYICKFTFSCVCGWVGLWEVQKLSYVGL